MDSCIWTTDQLQPFGYSNYTKLKHGITDLYKIKEHFFLYLKKICFRLQFTNTWVLPFRPFKLQLKYEHFLKVKVKCYNKRRMISYWKVHRFYLIYIYIYIYTHDKVVNWIDHILLNLVSNEHISITSIKCFSITIEDINQNINMAVMFFRHSLVIFFFK